VLAIEAAFGSFVAKEFDGQLPGTTVDFVFAAEGALKPRVAVPVVLRCGVGWCDTVEIKGFKALLFGLKDQIGQQRRIGLQFAGRIK
jgi:hypothetical protein